MARIVLTDKYCTSKARLPLPGQRAEYRDALVPGLALRVTDKGHRSFVLIGRLPLNPKNPSRRLLGEYGAITLEQARDEAREWHALLRKGIDPKVEQAKQRAATRRAQANSFELVANQFLTRHTDKLAKAKEARHIIESEFVKRWGTRPVTDIQPQEVATAIRTIAKRSEAMAHISLAYLRRLYSWSIGTHEFGVDSSPVERLKPADLIGKRNVRDRVLTDDELRAVWNAAGQIGYSSGPMVQMLILTGGRLREISELSWKEIDLEKALIAIPGHRMKGKREHVIPIAPMALALCNRCHAFGEATSCSPPPVASNHLRGSTMPSVVWTL